MPLLRPITLAQFVEAIRLAHAVKTPLHIQGSGSTPAPDGAQVLATTRLNQIIAHSVADMTVTAQAGITLEALQKHLAWHNQWLPIDPPAPGGRSPGTRTLGGLIAGNALGPLRQTFGDWRLLLLGLHWVDAGGSEMKGGGQTVKNVAGYSTPRMLIGSRGLLGAITQVTLRTFARPEDERAVLFFCPDAGAAEALLAAIFVSPTTPAYLQLIGASTFAGNPLQLPAPLLEDAAGGASGPLVLFAGFLGRPEVCQAQVEISRGLPEARGMESITQTAAQAGRLRLWMTSEPASERGAITIHALSSQVAGLVARIETLDVGAWVVAEAGAGVVRAAVSSQAALQALMAQCHSDHLPFTQAHGLPALHPLAGRIKAALDPNSILV